MTPEGLSAYLERNPSAARGELVDALSQVRKAMAAPGGRSRRQPPAADANDLRSVLARVGAARAPRARPEGRSSYERIQDIISSVRDAVPMGSLERDARGRPSALSIWLSGANLMTYNQSISTFQSRLPQYFRYKSAMKKATITALNIACHFEPGVPLFDGQVIVEVLRIAPRLMDRDGFEALFKIPIDVMRRQECRVFRDDNPNIVVEVLKYQDTAPRGSARIGIGVRVRPAKAWRPPPAPDPLTDWHVEPARA